MVGGVICLGGMLAIVPLKTAWLLVTAMTAGVLLLSQPLLSIYLLIPIIPLSGLLAVPFGGLRVGLMEIVLVGSIILILLKHLVNRQPLPNFNIVTAQAPFLGPFLIFFIGISLSWLNTFSIRATIIETIKWIEMVLLYLLIVLYLPSKQVRIAVTIILITGVTQALLGLYQFVFKVGPDGFLLFDGLFMRAYGTFGQPNPYAGYLGLTLPLAVTLTHWKFNQLKKAGLFNQLKPDLFQFGSLTLTVIILMAALFATQSRGGWLAALIALAVILIIVSYWMRLVVIMGGITILLLGLVGSLSVTMTGPKLATDEPTMYDTIVERFVQATAIFQIEDVADVPLTDANFSTLERLAHWQAAWHMWRDQFWLGMGFGNYEAVYPVYAVGRWEDPLGHAHNYVFNLGAETGFIGIICYFAFWILVIALIWQFKNNTTGFQQAIVVGGLGILIHLHIHNLFDNLYVQGMYLHVAIILALISIVSIPPYNEERGREREKLCRNKN